MEPKSAETPLVAIVGQTASGKSALALQLAERFNGEIIAADSRTIYIGMDIGTAKPSLAERRAVPHHLLDIAIPSRPFTVADFQQQAHKAIDDMSARGKLPILVGGTELYVDSVLYNFTFRGGADQQRRKELEQLSVEQLQLILREQGIPLPGNDRNPRHLIRYIETGGALAPATEPRLSTLVIGLLPHQDTLKERITQRVDTMFASGLRAEAKQLAEKFGWDCAALQTIGYQEFRPYLEGKATIEETKALIIQNTIRYSKRQRTWFKRNKSIHWISKPEEAVDLVTTLLNK